MAAAERAIALASTTSTTGASSSLATWAVEASSPPPLLPSKRPITPSTTAMSASVGTVGEEGPDHLLSGDEGVEVASGAARREGVIRGVYKVRPDLEGGDPVAPTGERRHQARGDGGLSDARVGARDDYAGGVYHSMPFWPL